MFYKHHSSSIADEDGKCGSILTEPEDQITSVDRDGDGLYDPHLSCRTIIAAPKNFKIEIIFIDFNLTGYSICFQDFVLVSFVVLCSLVHVCEVCLLCTWLFLVIHIPLINKLGVYRDMHYFCSKHRFKIYLIY